MSSELKREYKGCDEVQSHESVRLILVLCTLEVYSEKRQFLNSKVMLMPLQGQLQ